MSNLAGDLSDNSSVVSGGLVIGGGGGGQMGEGGGGILGSKYKTALCHAFQKNNRCANGDTCRYVFWNIVGGGYQPFKIIALDWFLHLDLTGHQRA